MDFILKLPASMSEKSKIITQNIRKRIVDLLKFVIVEYNFSRSLKVPTSQPCLWKPLGSSINRMGRYNDCSSSGERFCVPEMIVLVLGCSSTPEQKKNTQEIVEEIVIIQS